MRQHAYLLLYAMVLVVALLSFCAIQTPRPERTPIPAQQTTQPLTTLIPPVTTTPQSTTRP